MKTNISNLSEEKKLTALCVELKMNFNTIILVQKIKVKRLKNSLIFSSTINQGFDDHNDIN